MEGFVDYRKINRAVMDNTMELCGRINSLKDSIDSSIRNEYVVYQSEPFETGDMQPNPEMKILVSGKRTFEAAEAYKGKKVCCLDFANAYSMGGAPWSAGAQEESICRLSTLYPCLYAQKEAFYDRHIMEYDEEEMDDMGNDDLIYIPGITVFKTDESIPKLMDEDTWFKTDVIVAAAPQLNSEFVRTITSERRNKKADDCLADYRDIMKSRIKRILDVAAKEKVEVLILGAFGCGAFYNPPEIVADIFADLIRNYPFETVEFAVYCRGDMKNFDVFAGRMGEGR